MEALGEPARHQAHHALVPAVAGDQQQGQVGIGLDQPLGVGDRLLQHARLDGLALAVELVEQHGDARRLHLVVGGEQARAERGIADASAGVDARAQHEAQMIGRGRHGEAGGIGERAQPGVAALAHDLQALGHVGAVEALERHHIAHGGEADEVEQRQQVGRRALGAVVSAPAQLARGGDQQHEGDAGGAQVAEARQVVLAVGVDDGGDIGQALVGLVVVDDDDIGAERAGRGQRLDARWCRSRP